MDDNSCERYIKVAEERSCERYIVLYITIGVVKYKGKLMSNDIVNDISLWMTIGLLKEI